jgi:outer membrane protein assembly factor BamB
LRPGRSTITTATESNNVHALDAVIGSTIWQQNVGAPVPLASLPCGNIHPEGITGISVIDLGSRSILLDALSTPIGGATRKHLIYSLNLDTRAINSGRPVEVYLWRSISLRRIHFRGPDDFETEDLANVRMAA